MADWEEGLLVFWGLVVGSRFGLSRWQRRGGLRAGAEFERMSNLKEVVHDRTT
jgi:hypothetical protein